MKKRCKFGRNKVTGSCLKHPRPRKKASRKRASSGGRKGNCAKFGISARTGRCRKGPVTNPSGSRTRKTGSWDPSQPIRWSFDGFERY